MHGSLRVVKYITALVLDRDPPMDIDFHTNDNEAIKLAIRYGHMEIIQHFVETNIWADLPFTDLYRAAVNSQSLDILKYILESREDYPAMVGDKPFSVWSTQTALHEGTFRIYAYMMNRLKEQDREEWDRITRTRKR